MPLRWEEKNALIQQKLQKEDKQGSRSLSHSQGGPSPATLNSQVTILVSSEVPDQIKDIFVNLIVNLKPLEFMSLLNTFLPGKRLPGN